MYKKIFVIFVNLRAFVVPARVIRYHLSMAPTTPYTEDLAGRDPIDAFRDTLARFRTLLSAWSPPDFDRSYAPGKWSARQILVHLAQTELGLGARARLALTTPGYVAQAFDQDRWLAREGALGAREALDALLAVGAMNASFFASLSSSDCKITFSSLLF